MGDSVAWLRFTLLPILHEVAYDIFNASELWGGDLAVGERISEMHLNDFQIKEIVGYVRILFHVSICICSFLHPGGDLVSIGALY